MSTVFAAVAALTIVGCLFSAGYDFARYQPIAEEMGELGLPRWWLPWLGVPKAAAALGLLVGFWLPALATAAAAGLTVFFVLAVLVHWRARDYGFGLQYVFLLLAVGTLVLAAAR